MRMIVRTKVALFVCLALNVSTLALAEDLYQGKRIRFVVGLPPGGGMPMGDQYHPALIRFTCSRGRAGAEKR